MEALLLYQVKVAVLVAALFGAYRLLLGRETFHRFNRLVLITIALLSFVLPLFHITRQTTVTDAPEEVTEMVASDVDAAAAQTSDPVNLLLILLVLYGAGVLFVLIKKGISVWAMSRIIRKGRYADRSEGVDVIESDQIPGPLNWMKFVVMPREWLERENASVWKHENLHAHRWHSLDLLMADIMTAFQWFNPIMILLRKEFELIHEFEADKAVIDSGANPKEYKLMLVNAVAANRGMAMTSWLKQSNLKKRIDMMDKKQSSGWRRLRVLFIPAIAYFFLFATANVNVVRAQEGTFRWPVFEDGKTWIFQDGSAKVRTFDGVQADMKASEVAQYLKNYQGFKTTRMTLMFEYPIESLAEVQPYAEQLNAVGIKTSVATNEEMLARMTMPEFRVARVYDEGNGKYRFELICNSHDDRLRHFLTRGFEYKYNDISITGDKALMLKWIDMFDGHGLAFYPQPGSMPYTDLEEMTQAAWSRGIDQVSAVLDMEGEPYKMYTLIPKGRKLSEEYPGMDADKVIRKYNHSRSTDYFDKGLHIENPRSFYSANSSFLNITDVVRTPSELILIFKSVQLTDLWIMPGGDWMIDVDGQRYTASKYEGLNDMIGIHYWSPDNGYYISSVHFDVAIPDDVKTIDIIDEDGDESVAGLQISETPIDYDNIRVIQERSSAELKTTHRQKDEAKDFLTVTRIDFSDEETKVYAMMEIMQNHAFPGYLGSDITLTLSDGQVLKAEKITGVPTDVEFDRHGDFVATRFKVKFPPVSEEEWSKGVNVFKANVCHEPVSVELNKPRPKGPTVTLVDQIAEGDYHGEIAQFEFSEDGRGSRRTEGNTIAKIVFDNKGRMTLSGSKSIIMPDGKYSFSWIKPDSKKNPRDERFEAEGLNKLEVKGRRFKMEFMVQVVANDDKISQYMFINETDEGATVLYLYPDEK